MKKLTAVFLAMMIFILSCTAVYAESGYWYPEDNTSVVHSDDDLTIYWEDGPYGTINAQKNVLPIQSRQNWDGQIITHPGEQHYLPQAKTHEGVALLDPPYTYEEGLPYKVHKERLEANVQHLALFVGPFFGLTRNYNASRGCGSTTYWMRIMEIRDSYVEADENGVLWGKSGESQGTALEVLNWKNMTIAERNGLLEYMRYFYGEEAGSALWAFVKQVKEGGGNDCTPFDFVDSNPDGAEGTFTHTPTGTVIRYGQRKLLDDANAGYGFPAFTVGEDEGKPFGYSMLFFLDDDLE